MFEEVLAALAARDNLHPPDIKNLIKAEFLHGAAAAFAACWRGAERERCLAAALALYDPAVEMIPARPQSAISI